MKCPSVFDSTWHYVTLSAFVLIFFLGQFDLLWVFGVKRWFSIVAQACSTEIILNDVPFTSGTPPELWHSQNEWFLVFKQRLDSKIPNSGIKKFLNRNVQEVEQLLSMHVALLRATQTLIVARLPFVLCFRIGWLLVLKFQISGLFKISIIIIIF